VSKDPPYWYDPNIRYSALYRDLINELWHFADEAIKDHYPVGDTDTSILANAIMRDYIRPERLPTNMSGYAAELGWSNNKVKRHMALLIEHEVAFEVDNRYYPSPYFVRGPRSSQVMVDKFFEVADRARKLAKEHAAGSKNFTERQAQLDKEIERLDVLFASHQLKNQ